MGGLGILMGVLGVMMWVLWLIMGLWGWKWGFVGNNEGLGVLMGFWG